MKKTSSSESASDAAEMRPEYRFDYKKARPNRFADPKRRERLAVVLDEDVAAVFTSADAVNRALRALIEAVPRTEVGHRG